MVFIGLILCRYECQWVDVNTGQRHKMGSATEYIGSVMNWIGTHIDNDIIFPKKSGTYFAKLIHSLN